MIDAGTKDMSKTTMTPSAKPHQAGHAAAVKSKKHLEHLDSPMRTMFGLVILWGSLMLIFQAHRMSDFTVRMETSSPSGAPQTEAQVKMMSSRDLMMQPFEVNMAKDSARNHFKNVAASCGLAIDDSELKMLTKEKRSHEFKGIPLYRAIHKLIDNRAIGFNIRGKAIHLFDQKLESSDPQNKSINWQADLDLSSEQIMVFPSVDSDIWFSIRMIRDVNRADNPWHMMQVELWRGAEQLNTIKPTLDDNGKALISMSDKESISFQVERKSQPKGNQTPGRFHLLLFSAQSSVK